MLTPLKRIVLRVLLLLAMIVVGLAGDVRAYAYATTDEVDASELLSQSGDDLGGGADEQDADDSLSDYTSPARDTYDLTVHQSGRAFPSDETQGKQWVHLDRSPRPPRA